MDATTVTPTDENLHILDLIKNTTEPIQIRANAGCGKTFMLDLIQRNLPAPALALAFNKASKETMIERFLSTTKVQNFNGFGLEVWNEATGLKCVIEKDKGERVVKTSNSFKRQIQDFTRTAQNEAWDSYSDIATAVRMAKSLGYVPERWRSVSAGLISAADFWERIEVKSAFIIDITESILTESIETAYRGNIDYDDQCYMPALFGGSFPKFPNALVDEDQDLNAVNIEMLRHLTASRLCSVGDPSQSIYAFRGAMPNGMNVQQEMFGMTIATLSTSFRCREAIVENARWRAPNFKWIKPGGKVARLVRPHHSSFPSGCVILSRNNAPLYSLALRLLSHGRSVSVGGSDIGPKIVGLLKKLGPSETGREKALRKVETWRSERLSQGSASADDTAECMRVFIRISDSLGQAITYAQDLLRQKGSVTLMTGHKAKGLEWPVVVHLDPHLIKRDDQDLNLRYVIQTRAMDEYYETTSQEIRW
jgi:hypothetical protein